jgi:mannosyltransferase
MTRFLRGFGRQWAALAAILGTGLSLRLYRLGAESLWYDEAVSVLLAQKEVFSIVRLSGTALEANPPLFDILLRLWILAFGTSEVVVRLPSALIGAASIALIFALGKRIFDWNSGLWAALLLSLSTFHLYYSQEARVYSLMVFLGLLVLLFFILVREQPRVLFQAGLVVFSVALCYSHTYGPFSILALNLYFFSEWYLSARRKSSSGTGLPGRRWALLQAIIAALYLPWIFKLVPVFGNIKASLTFVKEPTLRDLAGTFAAFAGGRVALVGYLLILLATLVFLLSMHSSRGVPASGIANSLFSTRRGSVALLLVWLVVPILLPALLSHAWQPVYFDRYTILSSIALYLLAGAALSSIPKQWLRICLLAFLVLASGRSLHGYFAAVKKDPWREAVQYVESRARASDVLIVIPGWASPSVDYYSRLEMSRIKLPADTENPGMVIVRQGSARGPRFWLVGWHIRFSALQLQEALGVDYRIEETTAFRSITVCLVERGPSAF